MIKYFKVWQNLDSLISKKIETVLLNNKRRTYISLFLILLGFTIARIPYVNIILKSDFLWPLIVVLVLYLLKISFRNATILCITLFIISPFFVIFQRQDIAETIGNTIYFLIWLIWIQLFKNYRNDEKRKKNE